MTDNKGDKKTNLLIRDICGTVFGNNHVKKTLLCKDVFPKPFHEERFAELIH